MNATVLNALISLVVGVAQIIVNLQGNTTLQPPPPNPDLPVSPTVPLPDRVMLC